MPDEQDVVYPFFDLIIPIDHGVVVLRLAVRIGFRGLRRIRLHGIWVKRHLMDARLCGSIENEPRGNQQYEQIDNADGDDQTALGTAQPPFFPAHLLFSLQLIVIRLIEVRFVFRKCVLAERILVLSIVAHILVLRRIDVLIRAVVALLSVPVSPDPVDFGFRGVCILDFILLRRVHGQFVVAGGIVCFVVLFLLHDQTACSFSVSRART